MFGAWDPLFVQEADLRHNHKSKTNVFSKFTAYIYGFLE